jgi:hypothetical protein
MPEEMTLKKVFKNIPEGKGENFRKNVHTNILQTVCLLQFPVSATVKTAP